MVLRQLKQHLRTRRHTSLYDLSTRFAIEPAIMRDMVQHWIRKGKARVAEKASHCGLGCTRCDPQETEWYEWLE